MLSTLSARFPVIFIALVCFLSARPIAAGCQSLEKIAPLLLDSAYTIRDTETSFILSTLDFHHYHKNRVNEEHKSSVQIVDACQPWPPRWFTTGNVQITDSMTMARDMFIDARYENGFITFYYQKTVEYGTRKEPEPTGYIICNERMEAVDTFKLPNQPLNYHIFHINRKGEKLVMAQLDTLLDFREFSNRPFDSLVKATIDLVEIYDSTNQLIFRFNPVKELGVSAFHYAYRWDKSYSAKPGFKDWSHGNAADWDFDGNIIYSFRYIGIGKINRNSGQVMWRLDRNKMPFAFGTDTVAFYMQHGFEKVSDNQLFTTYALFSNGDNDHNGAYAMQFSVNKQHNEMRLLETRWPFLGKTVYSISSGNYEPEKNGDYLLNYGVLVYADPTDTAGNKFVLEYGNNRNELYGLYTLPFLNSAFSVRRLDGWRPPRPQVVTTGQQLKATGSMHDWVWYQLSGPENTIVTKVGEGVNFKPTNNGVYCVAGKYGIGYAVSLPFTYKQ